MKCSNCGFENKDKAKFCTKCGSSLNSPTPTENNQKNHKGLIIVLVVIIVILAGAIGYFALNGNFVQNNDLQENASSPEVQQNVNDKNTSETPKTQSISSEKVNTKVEDSKSWVSIGSYSGSGSGSQTIVVPEGTIKVKLSAYPIKNYATNYLYVTGSNGESGGVDWGSKSAVETRSDSFKYTSNYEETFTIDYYETVSWEVEFFRYQ